MTPGSAIALEALEGCTKQASWRSVERPGRNHEILTLWPIDGSHKNSEADLARAGGIAIGYIQEGKNGKPVNDSDEFGVKRGGKACVIVFLPDSAEANLDGTLGGVAVLVDPASGKYLRSFPMSFRRHSNNATDWACWLGDPSLNSECDEAVERKQLLDKVRADSANVKRILPPQTLEEIVDGLMEKRLREASGGPWFSCAKTGCCRLS